MILALILMMSVPVKNLKEEASAILKSLETGNKYALVLINPNKYIQNNLAVPNCRGVLENFISIQPRLETKASVKRVF